MAPGRKANSKKAAVKAAPKAAPIRKNKKTPVPAPKQESDVNSELDSDIEETVFEDDVTDSDNGESDSSEIEEQPNSSDEEAVEDDQDESEDNADFEAADSDDSASDVDEAALLAGLNDSDNEFSESEGEEDTANEFAAGDAVIPLDAAARKKLNKKVKAAKSKPGVVYVGRLPHGFYEEELLNYFKQFGRIRRLRLSRNRRTGRSRHYGFIEFEFSDVAEIVAQTMHNYLMFDRLLQCRVVPEDKVHERLFANRFKSILPNAASRRQMAAHNRPRTVQDNEKTINRLVAGERKKRARLAAAGIDYDFPGYEKLRAPKAKHVKYD
ncbi:nucleolar protein [Linderina pennispora]|nr:nucleolar protein [Linderina pennispora]